MKSDKEKTSFRTRCFVNPLILGVLVVVHNLSCLLESVLMMPISAFTSIYSLLAMPIIIVQIVFVIKHLLKKNPLYKQHLLSVCVTIALIIYFWVSAGATGCFVRV